jgi:Asp-tRNA(Asn)/Glu-tRNA(Gln) amidotransferase A subunit family amidase
VQACLARIREVEPTVQAWQYLDEAHALAQARSRDLDRAEGRHSGRCTGARGIKDIIDTTDMPTEDGTVLHAGRRPRARRRGGGATARGRRGDPRQDRDHRVRHLPRQQDTQPARRHALARWLVGGFRGGGGGRHGAAGDRHADQCVDHPAGVVLRRLRLQADHGLISRHGVLKLSRSLDCVGLFARSLDDIALAVEQLTGFDENDPDTRPRARIPFVADAGRRAAADAAGGVREDARVGRADASTREAFGELVVTLGSSCEEYALPESVAEAWDWHRTIMEPRWPPISTSSTRRVATS